MNDAEDQDPETGLSLVPERRPGQPVYRIDTTDDGFVVFQWIVDQTTIAIKLSVDGALNVAGTLKETADDLYDSQERGGT